MNEKKPKLLLHICCAGCGVYIGQRLNSEFAVALFFYNPNIFPPAEYEARRQEVEKIAKQFSLPLVIGAYNHKRWLKLVSGHEYDPERGARCLICYKDRLAETAKIARSQNFDFFGTTLTVSPYKLAKEIITIGFDLAKIYGVKFLNQDFKKGDGFKKAVEFSRKLKLYRQNYCGCEFSR